MKKIQKKQKDGAGFFKQLFYIVALTFILAGGVISALVLTLLSPLWVPFEYIAYKTSPYGKNKIAKYNPFITASSDYKFYNYLYANNAAHIYVGNGIYFKDGVLYVTDDLLYDYYNLITTDSGVMLSYLGDPSDEDDLSADEDDAIAENTVVTVAEGLERTVKDISGLPEYQKAVLLASKSYVGDIAVTEEDGVIVFDDQKHLKHILTDIAKK